jgi:putative transposase
VSDESLRNLALMRLIDEQFLQTPWYGSRQMARHLRRLGHEVGRKRVKRLMRKMGLEAVYQRPKTTVAHPEHKICICSSPRRGSGGGEHGLSL